jgi:hypothetical protein
VRYDPAVRDGRASVAIGRAGVLSVVACAAAAAAAAVGCAMEGGAHPIGTRHPVVDHTRGFRLDVPGPEWRVLREADVRRTIPGAAAGAVSAEGLYGYVVVTRKAKGKATSDGGGAAADDDSMPTMDYEASRFEEAKFLGRDATYGVFTTRNEDVTMRFAVLTVARGALQYRLVAVGHANETSPDGSAFAPFFEAFTLLEDEPRTGPGLVVDADTYGVGWWIHEGTFESAAAGVRVTPVGGWALALEGTGAVEMGLVHHASGTFVALIVETAAGADRAALEASLEAGLMAKLSAARKGGGVKATLDGRALKLRAYRVHSDGAGELLYGVLWEGDRCVQVMVAYPSAGLEASRAALGGALASITFLKEKRAHTLSESFLARPDPEMKLGPTYVLERGVYRDVANAFSWRKPRGFWRVSAGEYARLVNAEAILHVAEAGLGVEGLVIAERAPGPDAAAYHRLVVERLIAEDPHAAAGKPEPLALGDAKGLVSGGEVVLGGRRFGYRIATTYHDGMAFQLLFSGLPANMTAAEASVREALGAFRFGVDAKAPAPGDAVRPDAPVWL